MQKRVAFLAYSLTFCLVLMMGSAVPVGATGGCGWLPAVISGVVTQYDPAQCGHEGSITIAGIRFRIPAGIDLTFVDLACTTAPQIVGAGPTFLTQFACRVPPSAVIGTGRTIRIYLDTRGQIQLVVSSNFTPSLGNNSSFGTSFGTTTTRGFDLTGRVDFVNATEISINDITIPLAPGANIQVAPGDGSFIRMVGTFNANNQLTSLVPHPTDPVAFREVKFCGMLPGGFGQLADNTGFGFSYGGPVTFNAVNACLNQFVCNIAQGRVPLGFTTLQVAPGTPLVNRFWTYKNDCYLLKIDQFGWLNCIELTQKFSDNLICGTVLAFTPSTPTANGVLNIGRIPFVIAPGHSISNSSIIRVGVDLCLIPNFCESVSSSPGKLVPAPAFSLLDGSRVIFKSDH